MMKIKVKNIVQLMILGFLLTFGVNGPADDFFITDLSLTFKSPMSTKDEDLIYLTGDFEFLNSRGEWEDCHWRAQCIRLERQGQSLSPAENSLKIFKKKISMRSSKKNIEFKINRGSWDSELSNEQGQPLSNFEILPETSAEGRKERKQIFLTLNGIDWKDRMDQRKAPEKIEFDNFSLHIWKEERGAEKIKRVIYAVDGETLYHPSAYSGASLKIDLAITSILSERANESFMVVGIEPKTNRYLSYDRTKKDLFIGDLIWTKIIPYVEHHYNVFQERENRLLFGVSLGANILLPILFEHNDLFIGGIFLSPFFLTEIPKVVKDLPRITKKTLLYFDSGDYGDIEQGYPGPIQLLEKKMREKIQKEKMNDLEIKRALFDCHEHSEIDWARRVEKSFLFLLNHITESR